ncbi:MAG: hypothetical protein ACRBCL_11685 [Maritimibacter sp.]
MSGSFPRFYAFAPHLLAAGAALLYAWMISRTPYVTSGLQFVAPLIVILGVHLAWVAATQGLKPGLTAQIQKRSATTALTLSIALFAMTILLPHPIDASPSSDIGGAIGIGLSLVFCVAVLIGVVYLIILVFRVIGMIVRQLTKGSDDPPNTRLFEAASLVLTFGVLGVASLEGLPQGFRFSPQGSATAQQTINAPRAAIWQALESATTPEVPLPSALLTFPQPVRVEETGGTALGATRIVHFSGREGRGALSLVVTARSDTAVTYSVTSDTTPFSGWIGFHAITYSVEDDGAKTRLLVRLDFDRHLAPAFAFAPMMKGAGYLAMGVLARDVKARAEG